MSNDGVKRKRAGHRPTSDAGGAPGSAGPNGFVPPGFPEDPLSAFFRSLARSGPPARIPDVSPEPIERHWPAFPSSGPLPNGTSVMSRHPAFEGIGNEPEVVLGRSSRSAARGRQTRLHSLKNRRTMFLRSALEYRHALDLELDGEVLAFCEEPVALRYLLGQQLARHRVDAFVRTRDTCEFVEVKYEKDACLPKNETRWPAIAAAFNALGYGYKVVTERHLRRAGRDETVGAIFERRQAKLPDAGRIEEIVAALRSGGIADVGALASAFPDCIDLATACAMARHGLLTLGLDHGFGPQMPVGIGPGCYRRIGLATRGVWK